MFYKLCSVPYKWHQCAIEVRHKGTRYVVFCCLLHILCFRTKFYAVCLFRFKYIMMIIHLLAEIVTFCVLNCMMRDVFKVVYVTDYVQFVKMRVDSRMWHIVVL